MKFSIKKFDGNRYVLLGVYPLSRIKDVKSALNDEFFIRTDKAKNGVEVYIRDKNKGKNLLTHGSCYIERGGNVVLEDLSLPEVVQLRYARGMCFSAYANGDKIAFS